MLIKGFTVLQVRQFLHLPRNKRERRCVCTVAIGAEWNGFLFRFDFKPGMLGKERLYLRMILFWFK